VKARTFYPGLQHFDTGTLQWHWVPGGLWGSKNDQNSRSM
jgi:hypothetical protein